MKNDPKSFATSIPKVGSEYIKLKTGKIVKWESFNDRTQVFEYKSPTGELSTVHRRDIEIPTSHEELEHLKKQLSN
jgi:hypothetical protein